jgi:hypothetical protein
MAWDKYAENQECREMTMTDEQIRLVLNLGRDEARRLLENGERALYGSIQEKMVKLVCEYDVQLPLNCLQFVFCRDRLRPTNTH